MTDKPETQSEVEPKDAQFWLVEIDAAKDRMSDWYDKAQEAEDRYRDEKQRDFGSMNILWANVETQKAAIGEDFGKPQVTRVNAPENDGGLSRHIANVWERTIAAAVRDSNDNHDIGLSVNDVFLPGRSTLWLELELKEDDKGNIAWVSAPLVRVNYKDYLEGPATRWGDLPWVARGHYFTRDELISECKLTAEEADQVPLNVQLPYENRRDVAVEVKGKEQFKRARVWEVWAKFPKKCRLFVAEGYNDKVLCWDVDPFKLKHFFPCPRPMLANGDEGWQCPLTDYSRYEDQARELDRVSERIYVLTETLKRRGVYNKKFIELQDVAKAGDNVLIAIEDFSGLSKEGGLQGNVFWEDLAPTITVLAELHKQRQELIQLIYELSGISDLARGMTDPNETLGAQKLKKSFGAGRFRARETDARRFAAEAYALKGEVIAEHYPREQIQEMSGIDLPTQKEVDDAKKQLADMQKMYALAKQAGLPLPPPDQEQIQYLMRVAQTRFTWEKVSKVLRSDYRRCYTVECETDQSQYIDEEADKTARVQLFQAVMSAFAQVAPMIAGNPENGAIFKELVMFMISSFRAGRSMEEGVEQALDNAIKKAGAQQSKPQDDPKAAENAINLQIAQTNLAASQVKLRQIETQGGADAQNKVIEQQTKSQVAGLKVQEAASKVAVTQSGNQAKIAGHQIDIQNKAETLAFDRATRATAQEALLHGPTQVPASGA